MLMIKKKIYNCDYLYKKLYDYYALQTDETPILINRGNRPAGSKSYMWVYRTEECIQTDRAKSKEKR